MKTKEAIDCIKGKYEDVWLEGNCRIGQKELLNERDEVISLLQQGENYKEHYEKGEEDFKTLVFQHSKLWKENSINKEYKEMWGEIQETEYPSDIDFNRIEQKHFPKEADHDNIQ